MMTKLEAANTVKRRDDVAVITAFLPERYYGYQIGNDALASFIVGCNAGLYMLECWPYRDIDGKTVEEVETKLQEMRDRAVRSIQLGVQEFDKRMGSKR